ncbi:ABC transporter ATP-binding protein [Paenibacillus sp. PAMC21692]|uniref:ABC transporter ATP-binding protein n=1 Tax=Paenibacillus sp. PAMC21692 TaxID=2762320 RepID=UPI00164E026A|nr:ABC transporter ATP-binding protein [Paenibacillus sp. PAMC21692]QNK59902.1 ABC transporter ATP-binding protein [Paenibacillus sp. PAMC21692]
MKEIWHYVKQLFAYSGASLYINLFGMVAGSLLESVGLLLLIPLLGLIGLVSLDVGGGYFTWIGELLSGFSTVAALCIVLGVYAVTTVIQNLIYRSVMIQGVLLQQRYSRQLRMDTYGSVLGASWTYFLRKRGSDIINVLTIELARVLGAMNTFLQLVASVIFTAIQVGIAFWLSPMLTLFVLVCGIILGLLSRRFIRRAKELGSQTSLVSQQYLAGITDGMNGMKDIKSNSLERSRMEWMQGLMGSMIREQMSYVTLRMNSQLLYKLASTVLIAGFILAVFLLFRTQGIQLLTITVIFARLWPRFTAIQSSLESLASMAPACKAVRSLTRECQEAAEHFASSKDSIAPLAVSEGIECRNIQFRYSPDSPVSLSEVNLFIPAGSMTAIAGPSGAGKSTLIDVIMGLMVPSAGEIVVDGTPLVGETLAAYRRSIGYVPQDPFLFNATIRENMTLVLPDASDEQIWEALRFASCEDFVNRLPEGLNTVIGDRGVRLSGGERQRLVLARAIIRKPSVLVLDEATSALDTENESNIQEAIDRLKGSMTIIVIAHRLTTLRGADRVYVLQGGRIVEEGDFANLAADRDGYLGKSFDKMSPAHVSSF